MPNPPNGRERLRPLREDVRTLTEGEKDIAHAGYVRTCRRPRVRGFNEMVEREQADRIEGYLHGGTPFMYGDD
jgi:hypothetical protein